MAEIVYQDRNIQLEPGELVLDALLRQGHVIPYGCRAGVCQSCLMVAAAGDVPDQAQKGLNESQKKLNYFLSCQCQPETSLTVDLPGAKQLTVAGEVIEKTFLNDQVIRLRLQADLDYLPGQYVNLWRDGSLSRSYSLASVPELEDYLEFHIKLAENGRFSGWLKNSLSVGDNLGVQGPMGKCVFTADSHQPILMAGISTGLAPLYGLLRQALSEGHTGAIHLLLGAREDTGFYLLDELIALSENHPNLILHFISQHISETSRAKQGDIYAYSREQFADLKGWRVFLCGAASFVQKMQKHCFLSGAAIKDISADSFVAAS